MENKIIKIGAICVVGYIGLNITCNVARLIAKKKEEKRQMELHQKRIDKYVECMKKYNETNDLQKLMDAVFYM